MKTKNILIIGKKSTNIIFKLFDHYKNDIIDDFVVHDRETDTIININCFVGQEDYECLHEIHIKKMDGIIVTLNTKDSKETERFERLIQIIQNNWNNTLPVYVLYYSEGIMKSVIHSNWTFTPFIEEKLKFINIFKKFSKSMEESVITEEVK